MYETAEKLLSKLLLRRHDRLIAAVQEKGLPPLVAPDGVDVEFEGTTMRASMVERYLHPLGDDHLRHRLSLDLGFDEPTSRDRVDLSSLHALLGNYELPFMARMLGDRDALVALHRAVIVPLTIDLVRRVYGYGGLELAQQELLATEPSANSVQAVASSLAAETVTALRSGTTTLREALAIGGVAIEGSFIQAGGLLLRQMTTREREDVGKQLNTGAGTEHVYFLGPTMPPGVRLILEAESRVPIGVQPASANRTGRAALALQLLGARLSGTGWALSWTEPPPGGGVMGTPVSLLKDLPMEFLTIDSALLQEVATLADLIAPEALGSPETRQQVALNRFHRGASAGTAAEALLEHTIGLEATLLPPRFDGELKYRLRLGAAWLLGQNRSQRGEFFDRVGRIYDLRSQLVHGSTPPTHDKVVQASDWAAEILRHLLLRCLREGWPTDRDLMLLALGPDV